MKQKKLLALFMATVLLVGMWTGNIISANALESIEAETVTEGTEAETTEEVSEEAQEPSEEAGPKEENSEEVSEENGEETSAEEEDFLDETDTGAGAERITGNRLAAISLYTLERPSVSYSVHMQSYGWLDFTADGVTGGLPGSGKRLEAIKVQVSGVEDLGVSYKVYSHGDGWKESSTDGAMSGTVGEAKRIEAVSLSLTGAAAGEYDLYYRVYMSGYGWLDWTRRGQIAGADPSRNMGLEAIEIVLQKRGTEAPGAMEKPYLEMDLDDGYPNTHVNTGNRVADIVAVAKSQCGYHKTEGENTKYGVWYNKLIGGNGTYYPSAPWCAMFVSWCAQEAEIPAEVFKKHSYTVTLASWYQNEKNPGIWHEPESYIPKAGDLIFFKYSWNSNPVNHVGIVTKVQGSRVYTVEGNTADSVAERNYPLTMAEIAGYATPDYMEEGIGIKESVSYCVDVEGAGWQTEKTDGEQAGTIGSAKRLQAIRINVFSPAVSGGVSYRAHMQTYGWQDWISDGKVCGIPGGEKRMEAVEIKLTGDMAEKYDIYYRVHCQTYGWLDWAKNGAPAGSEGLAKRVEAIEIRLLPKGSTAPGKTEKTFIKAEEENSQPVLPAGVSYVTHCQTYGWLTPTADGVMNGTTGLAKRLEAICINLKDAEGTISYRTHVQTFGWGAWVSDGQESGTTGLAKRLEAIQIKLSGPVAENYDVYYRVHCQTYGWMGWAKNGEPAGSAGLAKRLEAIEIRLLPKGSPAPGNTAGAYVEG